MCISTENVSGSCDWVSVSHLSLKKRFEYIKERYENITGYRVIQKGSREEAAGGLVNSAGSRVHVKDNSINEYG